MPKYTSTSDLYLGKKKGGFVKAGTVFEFGGKPNKGMRPVDEAARAAFKKAGFKVPLAPAPKDDDPKGAPGRGSQDKEPGGKSTGDQEVI